MDTALGYLVFPSTPIASSLCPWLSLLRCCNSSTVLKTSKGLLQSYSIFSGTFRHGTNIKTRL